MKWLRKHKPGINARLFASSNKLLKRDGIPVGGDSPQETKGTVGKSRPNSRFCHLRTYKFRRNKRWGKRLNLRALMFGRMKETLQTLKAEKDKTQFFKNKILNYNFE